MKKRSILFSVALVGIISVGLSACNTTAATSSSESEKFTITWKNYDGTVLEVDNDVPYGTLPTYDGDDPVKDGDSEYSHAFTGWSPDIVAVTDNATYTAQFTSSTNLYTVTWKNHDGAILEVDNNVPYGTTPTYNGDTPVKDSDSQFSYTFSGWSPAITAVTGNATYTAQFTSSINQYLITFENYDGESLQSSNWAYGSTPVYSEATPTKPSDSQFSYTFSGWSPAITAVTGNATYTAQFTSSTNQYLITFKNYDGESLQSSNWAYGSTPVYSEATPTKPSDSQYSYTFSGWSPAITAVTGNATYTAQFTSSTNHYLITFENYDGELLQSSNWAYGSTPVYSEATPTKPSDSQYSYTFSGWSPAITAVTGNAIYVALFDSISVWVSSTDDDFTGDQDGLFVYIGTANYVIIPEKIKGITITIANEILFSQRRNIAGVAFKKPKNIVSMAGLFSDSTATSIDLSNLDTSNVTNMSMMFSSSTATSIDLSNFDTSKVTNMRYMFGNSKAVSIDLSSFDTSNVTDMYGMFASSQATSLDLSSFDTSKVTDMSGMFAQSQATSLDLSSFDTSKVTNMFGMFLNSEATTLDLSSFDTSNVTDMSAMFVGSQATSLDLSSFDTSNVETMYRMFLRSQATFLDLSSFDTSKVTDMNGMFSALEAATLNLSSFDTSKVTDMNGMFYESQATSLDLSSFDTSNVTDMSWMFYESQATSLDLSSFDTSNVTDMSGMFYGSRATSLDLSNFDTSNVADMSWMFYESQATSLDLSSFDTSNVADMSWMFAYSQATSLDLSSFDTSNVTDMSRMFYESQATSLDLSSFDTSNVTDMSWMFAHSQATSLDLSSFDTSKVTDMYGMFYESQATSLDLSNFDTSNVADISGMFHGSLVTSGYARNEAEAAKFNAEIWWADYPVFIVKP